MKFTTVSMSVFFIMSYAFFFGINDNITAMLILMSVLILFFQIHEVHISSRQVLREHTKTDGKWYFWLTGSSIFTFATAIIISFVSSIILLLVLKGFLIHHPYSTMPIIILCSYCILIYLEKNNSNNILENNLKESAYIFTSRIINLFLMVILVNTISTVLFSILDTQDFITNDITIFNFEDDAIKHRIPPNEYNTWSFFIINSELMLDSLKTACVNFIISNLFHLNKYDNIIISYFVIVFINFIKLFGFSFAFVYLQKSFYEIAKKYL